MKVKPESLRVPSMYGTPITPAWYETPEKAPQPDESAPYSVADAATALNLGLPTVKELIKTGELRSFVARRRRLVPREAVAEYIGRRSGGKRRK